MNYSDLFVVVALVAALYGLIVALARQKHFLTRAVNPHRGAWLLAGLTCLWFGLGLLRLESPSWSAHDIAAVLASLVTDAPLSTRGKVAAVAAILGLLPAAFSTRIGSESQKPLAIVVVGGMIGTLLFFNLVPVLYSFYGHREPRKTAGGHGH